MSQQPFENPQTLPGELGTSTIRLTRLWQWALVAVVIVAMYVAVNFVASRACDVLGSICADGEGSVSTILHKVLDDFSFVGILICIWVAAKLLYGKRLPRSYQKGIVWTQRSPEDRAIGTMYCHSVCASVGIHFRVDRIIRATSIQ